MLQPLLMRSHWVFLVVVVGGGSFQSQPATQLQVRLFRAEWCDSLCHLNGSLAR